MVRDLVRLAAMAALLLGLFFSSATFGEAETNSSNNPDAASIVSRMRQALAPSVPSLRVMTLTTNTRSGSTTRLKLGQARAEINGSSRMLTVVLVHPSQGQGIALLDEEKSPTAAVEQIYLPAAGRVQQFTPVQAWEPFFGSEFTYQDFSFPRPSSQVKLAGKETHNGVECYKLEETLLKNPYYSKVQTWIAVDSELPVQRDYYDLSGKLYKVERYEQILTVQGIPTITKIAMRNVQQDSSSEIDVKSIEYYKEAPQKLFDPEYLPKVASDEFWKKNTR